MEGVIADLHVHTTRSDGTVDPAELAGVAAAADLDVVAVTDHERLPPPALGGGSVSVVGGIELRVEADDLGRMDLLGYGVDRGSADLEALVEAVQADRIHRARSMGAQLEAALEIDLEVDPEPGVGRPHLARAVAARTDLSYEGVFERYIDTDGPCYVERTVPRFERGRSVLSAACDLVVLAHPMRYDDPASAIERAASLDGIEYVYPYDEPGRLTELEELLPADTLKTGGSDAHTAAAVGTTGLDRAALEPVAGRLQLEVD